MLVARIYISASVMMITKLTINKTEQTKKSDMKLAVSADNKAAINKAGSH